jgi:hypothetical protein
MRYLLIDTYFHKYKVKYIISTNQKSSNITVQMQWHMDTLHNKFYDIPDNTPVNNPCLMM